MSYFLWECTTNLSIRAICWFVLGIRPTRGKAWEAHFKRSSLLGSRCWISNSVQSKESTLLSNQIRINPSGDRSVYAIDEDSCHIWKSIVAVILKSKTTSIDEPKELYKGSLSLPCLLHTLSSLRPLFFENGIIAISRRLTPTNSFAYIYLVGYRILVLTNQKIASTVCKWNK